MPARTRTTRAPQTPPADTLAVHIQAAGLPEPTREYAFAKAAPYRRRFRADFAFPGHMLLVEVDGATWSSGRHVRGAGFERDCEKLNLAALLGFRVLRFTSDMVRDGRALATLERALAS